jgi:hypothetical protein
MTPPFAIAHLPTHQRLAILNRRPGGYHLSQIERVNLILQRLHNQQPTNPFLAPGCGSPSAPEEQA